MIGSFDPEERMDEEKDGFRKGPSSSTRSMFSSGDGDGDCRLQQRKPNGTIQQKSPSR